MIRYRIHPAVFLVALFTFLILEVAFAIWGGDAGGYFYSAKALLCLANLLGLPLTFHAILKCLSREESIWDKAFWSGFIVMTQFVGALFYLLSKPPEPDCKTPAGTTT